MSPFVLFTFLFSIFSRKAWDIYMQALKIKEKWYRICLNANDFVCCALYDRISHSKTHIFLYCNTVKHTVVVKMVIFIYFGGMKFFIFFNNSLSYVFQRLIQINTRIFKQKKYKLIWILKYVNLFLGILFFPPQLYTWSCFLIRLAHIQMLRILIIFSFHLAHIIEIIMFYKAVYFHPSVVA